MTKIANSCEPKTKKVTLIVFVTVEIPENEDGNNLGMRIDLNNSYPIKLDGSCEQVGEITHFKTDGCIED